MILFDETENKYYGLLAHMLQVGAEYSRKDIRDMLGRYLSGEEDFEVTEALFATDEGEEFLFAGAEGVIEPVLEGDFPIRNSILENQAMRSLVRSSYAGHFLRKDTMEKLEKATDKIPEDWTPDDITLKNVSENGIRSSGRLFDREISVIAKAIHKKCAIRYDNVRPGRVEKKDALAFPVRIEYSVVNDRFRINAYEPVEMRFIKMNLDTMANIEVTDETADVDLEAEYIEFIKLNTRKVVLDVEPVDHIIERCFRVFSYYDRKARYDKEGRVYRLEISYLKADENEIIKKILAMGSHVVDSYLGVKFSVVDKRKLIAIMA